VTQADRAGKATEVVAPKSGDPSRVNATGRLTTRSVYLLMAIDNPTDRGSSDYVSPAEEDDQIESAALVLVLIEHPSHLTVAELSRALNDDPDDFASKDAIDRAVRALVGGGLLNRHGDVVMPTRAALYFARLRGK
jgi:hypothetical protein